MFAGLTAILYVYRFTHIAFTWYVMIGAIVTFVVGALVSRISFRLTRCRCQPQRRSRMSEKRLELVRGAGCLGFGRDRRRHHDWHGNFSEAGRDGARGPLRLCRFRGMDRRRDSFALRRALLCRTRRGNSGGGRRVRLPASRLRPSVGISFWMDALDRWTPVFDVFDRGGTGAVSRLPFAGDCHADLHMAHRDSRHDSMDQTVRFRFHMGTTGRGLLAVADDRSELSWRAARRRGTGISHRDQDHFRGDRDRCGALRTRAGRIACARSDLAFCA